jgi:hypothetical protein
MANSDRIDSNAIFGGSRSPVKPAQAKLPPTDHD